MTGSRRCVRLSGRVARLVAVVLVLAVAVVSCAGQPRREAARQSPDALYATLELAMARYRDGLHGLRGGDVEGGPELMQSASAELAAGGDACVSTPGCEPQRFMAAYGNLLSLRSAVLTNAAEGFAEARAASRRARPRCSPATCPRRSAR
jgi:hypothetical protein